MNKYLIALLVCFLIIGFLLWDIYLPKNSLSKKQVLFSIEKGQGSREIALNLQEQGLVKWSSDFRLYVATKGISSQLQAGSYSLSYSMNVPQMVNKFVLGEVIKIKLVAPEGYRIKDIEENLLANGNKTYDISELKAKDFKGEFGFLKSVPDSASLEGFLFPDTYEFSYEASKEDIAKKMLDNFDQKLTAVLRQETEKQKKTIFDIITMASLIEKEVKTKEDKEIVSGILWKRLKSKMPLQVDATILYLTAKENSNVSIDETKIDSPYNTYKYLGLPQGPICNPGIESIQAAIYPKSSVYWYYLSTPEGKTIFSRTLEEHNIAKYKYLKN
ncbi:MAG: endolytic transglycosylase MltG [Candidatus Nealsonbacteria bacterium]|nr:endolytic transglycosylase MltG [Candidatus Nealsonbacteria bacterium]